MAKVIDITEKLQFDENPKIVICGEEMEVNADAETVLRLMGTMSGPRTYQKITEALELLIGEEGLRKICSAMDENGRKLKVTSLLTILNSAVELAMGESSGGEQ